MIAHISRGDSETRLPILGDQLLHLGRFAVGFECTHARRGFNECEIAIQAPRTESELAVGPNLAGQTEKREARKNENVRDTRRKQRNRRHAKESAR